MRCPSSCLPAPAAIGRAPHSGLPDHHRQHLAGHRCGERHGAWAIRDFSRKLTKIPRPFCPRRCTGGRRFRDRCQRSRRVRRRGRPRRCRIKAAIAIEAVADWKVLVANAESDLLRRYHRIAETARIVFMTRVAARFSDRSAARSRPRAARTITRAVVVSRLMGRSTRRRRENSLARRVATRNPRGDAQSCRLQDECLAAAFAAVGAR